jgi:hypothetical protein
MKRTLLALALVAAAGTAGAQTVSTPATGNAGAGPTVGAPPASAGATMNNGATTNANTGLPNTGIQGAQTGAGTQTQMNSNGSAGASAAPDMANAAAQPLTGAARTAQKRIEQDGYKSVQNLQRGSDGLWHGTAMRGNNQVQVTVDRAGRVSAQ